MAPTPTTPASASQIKPTDLVRFHRALAKWYKIHGRHDLPWRNTDDPYRIWLSEVMLQQTQVATVRERFYFPFLKKFPTIETLAAAPSEAVMKAWEGLGYYSRARNLHAAAQIVVSRESSVLRKNWLTTHDSELTTLPGIGRNTAHAILAFAYHQPVAILEANVKRVVARVFALEKPSTAELWSGAETLLNRHAPFDYNQAMMDLGSMLCTPKNPHCDKCPASIICNGKATPAKYPTPKAKKQTPTREVTIHVREDARGRLFLEKREEALLGGLYGFAQVTGSRFQVPGRKINQKEPPPLRAETCNLKPATFLGTVTHTYSHFKLIGQVVHELVRGTRNSPDWHTRQEIEKLPLSALDYKVLSLVENCHSAQKKSVKSKGSSRRH